MRKFEWDEKKNKLNIEEKGLPFEAAKQLFDYPLQIGLDERKNYNEQRFIGVGEIDGRLMVVVFTKRKPNIIRIISFRKANDREQKKYYTNILG